MLKRKNLILIILLLIFLFISIWGFYIEPNQINLTHYTIQINKSKIKTKLKIVIISDLHIGIGYTNIDKLKTIVNMVNKESPDIIFNLGDYHSYTIAKSKIPVEDIAEELKKLKAKYGVYSILGNHDGLVIQHKYLDGRFKTLQYQKQMIVDLLKKSNITLLDDSFVKINTDKSSFYLVGLSDSYSMVKNYGKELLLNNIKKANYPNLKSVMNEIPEDSPVILLNHSPDIFPDTPSNVVLTLAGHTHAAHINLPLFSEALMPSIYCTRYRYGLIQEKNKYLIVSSGVGGFPFRLNAPPEIVILQLEGI